MALPLLQLPHSAMHTQSNCERPHEQVCAIGFTIQVHDAWQGRCIERRGLAQPCRLWHADFFGPTHARPRHLEDSDVVSRYTSCLHGEHSNGSGRSLGHQHFADPNCRYCSVFNVTIVQNTAKMARPKLTLFLDVVSPFAYMAFYITKVSFYDV